MKTLVAVSLLALSTSMRDCAFNPTNPHAGQPNTGDHQLGVTFQHWNYSGACAAAVVSMWSRLFWGSSGNSQQDIIDWMRFQYPNQVGPDDSFSSDGIRYSLSWFAGVSATEEYYIGYDEKRHGLADIKKGISVGNPTIVVTNSGLHAKLVKGASWQIVNDIQPYVDYISYDDPQEYSRIDDTVSYFMNYSGSLDSFGTGIRAIGTWGQRGYGSTALADYDTWGGTFYGDPTPPGPTCGPGCYPPGAVLYPGYNWDSDDGSYHLSYQGDGNLVLYDSGWSPVWATNTAGASAGYATFQGDGNFVVYNASDVPVWASNTTSPPGEYLFVQNDGYVHIYIGSGLGYLLTSNESSRTGLLAQLAMTLNRLRLFVAPPATRMSRNLRFEAAPKPQGNRGDAAEVAQAERARLARRPLGPAQRPHHPIRSTTFVPKPFATDPADVIVNVLAGLKQSHLVQMEGWSDLNELISQSRLRVDSVTRVASLSRHPDYWIASISVDGLPFGEALVGEEGWVLSVRRVPATSFATSNLSERVRLLGITKGFVRPATRHVYMYNDFADGAGSAYHPFIEISDSRRGPIYVAPNGDAFEESARGEAKVMLRDGAHGMVKID